jgi:hypothetical protein
MGRPNLEGATMSSNRRAKIAASATVLGLAALGGVAMGTNQGVPVATQQTAAAGSAPVVTSASGATATPVSQPIAVRSSSSTRLPIVTRASGGGGQVTAFDD